MRSWGGKRRVEVGGGRNKKRMETHEGGGVREKQRKKKAEGE